MRYDIDRRADEEYLRYKESDAFKTDKRERDLIRLLRESSQMVVTLNPGRGGFTDGKLLEAIEEPLFHALRSTSLDGSNAVLSLLQELGEVQEALEVWPEGFLVLDSGPALDPLYMIQRRDLTVYVYDTGHILAELGGRQKLLVRTYQ